MIYLLNKEIAFPNPEDADEDGILAVGGDLSPERLILAYSYGIFPWFPFRPNETYLKDENGNSMITWWCPKDRFVIFPEKIHISHSMKQLINSEKYSITFNKDFKQVISNCSSLRINKEGAWLGPEMIKAYTKLNEMEYAISVEVWNNENKLVGGLYGVTIGYCFMGESMFSLEPNTSKLALINLANIMKQNNGVMIDCQFETPHLLSMGGQHISYKKYMEYLNMK
ncbi:MAG: leucyl/phenylalanyl-tRNA--protein transferase [Bacteroidales bacterium]|nr:leucyl/phenylalanyl-tRNA--protein transferase [Bacteroidales bacterium]